MLNVKSWSIEWGGRTLSVEVGKLALQTTASCTVRYGDTVIMATVVKSDSIREGIDYFPLMVDFEEKFYAAGKIKGSRFVKREGRPSDEAILSGRVIDRSIRPLFDSSLRNDIQVVLTALCVDQENDAAIVGLIAASTVLSISSIPWHGPIAGARIGRRKETKELILNVTQPQMKEDSDLDLVVAGTSDSLIMVEAGAQEVPEDAMYEAITWGLKELAPVVSFIQKIQSEVGLEKEYPEVTEETKSYNELIQQAEHFVSAQADTYIFDTEKFSRKERKGMVKKVALALENDLVEKGIDEAMVKRVVGNTKEYVGKVISERILNKDQRLDGRKLDEVRELNMETDLLPRVHGSGMFMRGETQVLSVVTLGAPGDVQTLDTMEEEGTKRYMHHYNDAPYSYGEAGFMRGPGRRAIGHGALAERALLPVLPEEEAFPYAIRVVSEVLGSNGSSSMASTCGSTLSLMAAGVPITKPVAGIAMGLASEQGGKWKVLTDLQDVEDGNGGMDFKITGTRDGITAVQMDTKTMGLNFDIIKQTLTQGYQARVQILEKMTAVIPEPRAELSEYAPRIETITVDPEKIGEIIGPGGKTIKKIIEDTGVDIDIQQDGRVLITSNDAEAMQKAKEIIGNIVKEVEAGEIYEGKVVRLEDFGAFVNILPGKDGLVHVSEIAWERTNKPSDILKIGDMVKVKVKEIDNLGRVNLSIKALLPRPENFHEERPHDNSRGQGGAPRNKFFRGKK
ncbi:MAG: polyribonucleotide nucleotidyltransferase [Candidatus Magasanikbacteria bacterium CG11_big_fil_rev_8_21_14_0_20_39_34]|uniref:Polyribonucleotide nucleotidyltransferase n=1 Tax=Candidatus Magasanikbacteria bacterium CG11_big_fil_rev_8_21_14_0_20_39_34 TaxID=1974653 RepID=A0A2H0N6I0_9BACT|nr:MAG: polyribonucleotide nucleotidyltransferase [Candidatus Magasanikbacteria bacterium CG11_big_fil_rev_8_21_14_0_20_39_34]